MEYQKLGNNYVVRIDKGEELLQKISELCVNENIKVGSITGLGATDRVTIGLFDTEKKVYHKTELTGPMEITSLVGNISTKDGKNYLHCHINVCDNKMNVLGGHLNECWISATGEFILTKIEGSVERGLDDSVGLNLFKFTK